MVTLTNSELSEISSFDDEFIDSIKLSKISPQTILHWFELADAYWLHDGSPTSPHAELMSGQCSNGYFDVPRLLSYPAIAEILARRLLIDVFGGMGLIHSVPRVGRVDWVISSAYSAITFGHEIAKELSARFMSVEKDPADPQQKKMLWRRIALPKGTRILQAEELITTMGTTSEVRRAVLDGNPEPVEFLPIVATLVHRPPKLPVEYPGLRIVSLLEREIWALPQNECPLCQMGSRRLKPKTHWAQLTGQV